MLVSIGIPPYVLCGAALALAASLFWFYRTFFNSTSTTLANVPLLTKQPDLPQGWWTDSERFKTEKRAIFSQTWICVSHRSRFVKAGDYIAFDIAGFRVLLMLGKDGTVRAFHNICRHRAFPVAKKASGSSTVLGCRYHGWSYDTKGQLTKAPHFDNVPGFEKSQNGLFPIHTRVDDGGFLHINMSASEPAGDELSHMKKTSQLAGITQSSHFINSWEVQGNFNWKVIANDTQHTFQTPATEGVSRLFSAKDSVSTGQQRLGPLTTVSPKPGSPIWYQVTYSPDSVGQTTVRCDVYSTKKPDAHAFDSGAKASLEDQIQAMVHQHEGIYTKLTGPDFDALGGGYEQAKIADMVDAHLEKEKLQGQDIKPATIQQCRSAAYMQAEGICRAMECGSEKLAW
ncbi:Rieske domain-containing protein [Fusarium keratoplasticum]|uniref:Rieske domain-containing protein n=1 Tax=Fusarium keratoplasticum TaxID=1328300 RepID=A0ACC0QUC8_9HYPO|nr:Rieske domain-containing protein [Fusarium keratoplasticum]KAI8666167.1 Rieske domain-containing protein [Fusarium keratoplasticum]